MESISKRALILAAAVAIAATGAMSTAYSQTMEDDADGYDNRGLYTGNPNECWVDDGEGEFTACYIDSGDTSFMIIATALVLFMTPGVAFFYGGMARSKNVVNVIGMTLIVMGAISWQWVAWGYSLSFGPGDSDWNMFAGSLDYAGFNQVSYFAPLGSPIECQDTASNEYLMQEIKSGVACSDTWPGTIPHALFAAFQGTFAIITPALIVGGLIDRMKFSALIIFVLLWATFVYDPVAHWIWGGGFVSAGSLDIDPDLSPSFALDFAGGIVVHVTSGFSALAAALVLGRRIGYGKVPMDPHNVPMMVLGVTILWFGWTGFNAGSEVMADGVAVRAMVVTNLAAGVGTVTWMLLSWAHTGKPSIVGAATGTIAGLGTITPAAGWVGPMAAIIIGIAAASVCYACVAFKNAHKWDDALDVWGVHGMGGITGSVLVGTLASPDNWDTGGIGAWTGTPEGFEQQGINIMAAGIVAGYSFGMTVVILKIMDKVWPGGIRVTAKEEEMGLDLAQHGELAYTNE
ncbi:ammonia permease [Cenarchaeum symbiosum A]|uniref:Ammonium transporter n=1 Tax=Cenarchaeum symbiosum (strain A) TaxID=414004 RepID=A0RUZ2_CENSY|nr:ammonia permease [Cenarchaeum symbiosum A]